MRNKLLIICIIFICLGLISCQTTEQKELVNILKEINISNQNIKIPDVEIEKYINYLSEEEMLTIEEFDSFFPEGYKATAEEGVDKEGAIKDIKLYIKALKTNYGLYNFYGGNAVFTKIEEETIEFINSKENVYKYEITEFLSQKLSFVQDKHFDIGSRLLVKDKYMYIDNNNEYLKDDNGYYKIIDEVRYYIKAINNDFEIDKYLKLSIGETGNIVYRIYMIKENDNEYSEYLLTKDLACDVLLQGDEEIKEEIFLDVIGNDANKSGQVFNYTEIENIPIITMKAMTFIDNDISQEFIRTAEKTKDSKVTIIDLRDNRGGDGLLPLKWIETRFGEIAKANSKGFYLSRIGGIDYNIEDELLKTDIYKYLSLEKINDNYYTMGNRTESQLIQNDNLIFVIVDKNTSSAGELFIEYLKGVENVIIVGSNTMGTLTGSSYGEMYLPNTKIEIGYGGWMRIYDQDFFVEGRGFIPDILLDDDRALEELIEMIKYYGIV